MSGFQFHCTLASIIVIVLLIIVFIKVNSAVGFLYKNDCPRQPFIPIYLRGYIGIIIYPLTFSCNNMVFCHVMSAFLFCWFISGSTLTYSIYEPNYNKHTTKADSYCNKIVYLFAFWSSTFIYVLLGVIALSYVAYRCCKKEEQKRDVQVTTVFIFSGQSEVSCHEGQVQFPVNSQVSETKSKSSLKSPGPSESQVISLRVTSEVFRDESDIGVPRPSPSLNQMSNLQVKSYVFKAKVESSLESSTPKLSQVSSLQGQGQVNSQVSKNKSKSSLKSPGPSESQVIHLRVTSEVLRDESDLGVPRPSPSLNQMSNLQVKSYVFKAKVESSLESSMPKLSQVSSLQGQGQVKSQVSNSGTNDDAGI